VLNVYVRVCKTEKKALHSSIAVRSESYR
jgi:hypothetical protein